MSANDPKRTFIGWCNSAGVYRKEVAPVHRHEWTTVRPRWAGGGRPGRGQSANAAGDQSSRWTSKAMLMRVSALSDGMVWW